LGLRHPQGFKVIVNRPANEARSASLHREQAENCSPMPQALGAPPLAQRNLQLLQEGARTAPGKRQLNCALVWREKLKPDPVEFHFFEDVRPMLWQLGHAGEKGMMGAARINGSRRPSPVPFDRLLG